MPNVDSIRLKAKKLKCFNLSNKFRLSHGSVFFKKLVNLSHGSDFSLKVYGPEPMAQISTKNMPEPEPWLKIYNNIP